MRRRLTLTSVAAVAVALVLVTAGFARLLSRSLDADSTAVLQARSEAALALVTVRDGQLVVADSASDPTLDATTWVFGPGGEVVLEPAASEVGTDQVAGLSGVLGPTFLDAEPDSRLLAVPIPGTEPGGGAVVVSMSLAPYERTEQIALSAAVLLDATIVALLALVTRWLVGAALRPVDRMTRQAQEWIDGEADAPVVLTASSADEIGHLARTLNNLLGMLDASLSHERRLTDEIAHELRTPLARARADAEISAAGDDPASLREALGRVVGDIDELSAAIDTLLRATRTRAGDDARCSIPRAVASAVAAARSPLPIDIGPAPAFSERLPGGPWAAIEEPLLARVLGPQLENAVRYAAHRIGVTWSVDDMTGDVVIVVSDDGPGLAPDETERVFEPGARGSAAAGSDGSGLGLALCRRLARSCGGDVGAEPGPGGRFLTTLPAA